MPPVFILILAAAIVAGLLLVAWELVTRPKRRRRLEAGRAAQRAAEIHPVPGLDRVVAEDGWQGPIDDPTLTPGLPFGGVLPEGHPLASHPLLGQVTRRAEPVSPAGYAGNLTFRLHAALNPDRSLRPVVPSLDTDVRPDYCPEGSPRLAHCYRVRAGELEYLVGNCWLTLRLADVGTAYRGPVPDRGYIGSAFCAVGLPRAILGYVQVVPREGRARGGRETGFADLDARYLTLEAFGSRSGSKLVRAAQAALPEGEVHPIGPRLAEFIASRGDWAFTLYSGLLVCATLEPLRSGDEARRLVADTARAAALVGR